jgi:hypothetical protein
MSNQTDAIALKALFFPFILGRYSLLFLRRWLERVEIRDVAIAHTICRLIPAQCPFERDIYVFNRKVGHIPPLCKLNPFYEEVVGLRFRALCYLADECGEDVSCYV